MLRHLACQHSGGDGFQPRIVPGLKSLCLSWLRYRTSGSPQPHRQTGFWNQEASAAALAFRTSHARLAPSILLVFIANLSLNSNTLRCSRAMFSAGYG